MEMKEKIFRNLLDFMFGVRVTNFEIMFLFEEGKRGF